MHVCVGARSVGVSAGACGVQKRVSEVALEPKASSELPDIGTVFPSSVRAVFTLSHQAVSPALQMTTARHVCKASLSHSLDRGSGVCLCSSTLWAEASSIYKDSWVDRGVCGSTQVIFPFLIWIWPSCFSLPSPSLQGDVPPPKKNDPFDS